MLLGDGDSVFRFGMGAEPASFFVELEYLQTGTIQCSLPIDKQRHLEILAGSVGRNLTALRSF
jgi:hypothetical protein